MSGIVGTLLGTPNPRGTTKVYRPKVEARLLKTVQRRDGVSQRFAAAEREIDLTPFLGEAGGISITKSLLEPAGGFSLSFPDQRSKWTADTVFALIEPMDAIEIRAAREPHLHVGKPLPLLMRGWVSSVRRMEDVGTDGAPRRRVVIHGQDGGKIWQINVVHYEIAYLEDVPFLDVFRMQAATGIDVALLPVSDFIRQMTERVVNKKIGKLFAYAERVAQPFRVDATVKQGIVSVNTLASVAGPYWQIAELFADRPWNELFIEDEEEGPVVRFRPAPYKDINGKLIMPDAVDPGTIEISDEAVVSLDLMRSDHRIANFFAVPSGSTMLDTGGMVNVASLRAGTNLDLDHGNNAEELYGIRKMPAQTRLLPNDVGALPTTIDDPTQREQAGGRAVLWHHQRAAELRKINRDNSVFEEGTATVRGHEGLKPGRYLRITRGTLVSEAYMTSVSHQIAPLAGWTTNVTLQRGTGFLERSRLNPSPYYAEITGGPFAAP